MRSVSVRLADLDRVKINLGIAGENEHTHVLFDCKKAFDQYPNATPFLIVTPPRGDIYPAVVTRDGDIVEWVVTDSDLIYHGNGKVQLQFKQGDIIMKSYEAMTSIAKSSEPTGTVPTPIQTWITQANAILAAIPDDINAALAAAKASGDFDGVGIASIAYQSTSGLVDTYTITLTDGNSYDFTVTNGRNGDNGVGIQSIAKTGTVGLVDTYTITLTNGQTYPFTVTNGQNGVEIDDTTPANNKVFSSAKVAEMNTNVLNAIQGKAETEITSETGIDLDITDEQGNVLVRLQNGEIQTKEFNSSLVADTKSTTETFSDLDITDPDGNVVLRLEDGNIKTKKFDSTDPFYVPEYYHTNNYLKNKCDRLNEIARACAKKSDTFAFVTDLHWHLNAKKSPALLKYIKENTRIDKYFCGGDICDFIESEHQPYDSFTPFIGALNKPIYTAMGNHDYMSIRGTEGRLYYSFNSIGRDRIGNFDRNYFYIDNQQAQIRYIFINGFQPNGSGSWTWGLEQDQITWLNNVALDLDSGWGAVIVTHMIVGIDLDTMTLYKPTMATNLLNELDSYNGNGEIIAVICGHTHFDYVDHSTGGIPIIVTTCDKYAPWISSGVDKEPFLSDRVEGTITEQAIDLFVIDREAKKITRVRVGVPIHDGFDPETWTEVEEETVSYDRN